MLSQGVQVPAVRPTATAKSRGVVRWLVGFIAVLAATVLVLGAMLVQPSLTTTPGEVLTDRVIAAWNSVNENEIREIYAKDAFLWTNIDTRPTASGVDEIIEVARSGGLEIERIGPVSERGHLVWALGHVTSAYDVSGSDEVVVFYVEDGRITQHWVIWDELE